MSIFFIRLCCSPFDLPTANERNNFVLASTAKTKLTNDGMKENLREKREPRKIAWSACCVLLRGVWGCERLSISCFHSLGVRLYAIRNEWNKFSFWTNEEKKASDLIVLRSLFAIKISRLRSRVQITLLGCAAESHTFHRFHHGAGGIALYYTVCVGAGGRVCAYRVCVVQI